MILTGRGMEREHTMSDACCAPLIDVVQLRGRHKRVLRAVLAINLATFVWMIGAAILSRSSAVLSGGLDNFGDALTYAFSLAVVGSTAVAHARVAILKGVLILGAATVVAIQIVLRVANPAVPLFETIGVAGILNLGANLGCLALLTPHRKDNLNMASVWECSRNDVYEGFAVLAAAAGVWIFRAGWPDLVVAIGLLGLFVRSGIRVLKDASAELGLGAETIPRRLNP